MAGASRRLIRSAAARRDLIDIWKYVATASSAVMADNLLAEIDRATLRLAKHPFSGRPRNDIAVGLRSILVSPYLVIYSVTDTAIEIVRVLHERRDVSSAIPELP